MSDIFEKLYNEDGTVDYIFNQKEFYKIICNFLSNLLIQYIEEFCKAQNTNNVLIIGTKENINKYKESTEKYFEDKVNLKFICVNEYILGLDNKNKFFIANNKPIEFKPIEFKYEPKGNLYLTSRYCNDIINVNKKIIMEED